MRTVFVMLIRGGFVRPRMQETTSDVGHDEVAVATFDRGVFPHLPAMVGEFRSYLEANDVEFIALDM